jgi:hypothetical protein
MLFNLGFCSDFYVFERSFTRRTRGQLSLTGKAS